MNLKKLIAPSTVGAVLAVATLAVGAAVFSQATPFDFDPGKTYMVQGAWLDGIGCPTDANLATPNAEFTDWDGTYTEYTDLACETGDSSDHKVEGLLLAKTGPSVANFASSGAVLKNVKGTELTEIGYDIRKPGDDQNDPRGSHCGAGAPRFNITTTEGDFYFLGCNSPVATSFVDGDGYIRLRWGDGTADSVVAYNATAGFVLEPISDPIASISIVFDEGYDTGPDNFGLAVLDNINVNGVFVGNGPTSP